MADSYLFKDQQSGTVKVGLQQDVEQTGKFLDQRNEFMQRNAKLQESLWAGRDSASMAAVKESYRDLENLMNEEIPQNQRQFQSRKAAIEACYDSLITNCEAYIESHNHTFTSGGKKRKAMVAAILSNAKLEKLTLGDAINNLAEHFQEGMIWGNLFGEMKENVDLCAGVYSQFESEFPEEEKAGDGSRTMELAKVIGGASVMKQTNLKGQLVMDMAKVWAQNNMSPELKKEFVEFRTMITRILVHDYRMILAHRQKAADFCGRNGDADTYRQFAQLILSRNEHYSLYKSLRELAPTFGLDPLSSGVEGEEVISSIVDNAAYFDRLHPDAVQRFIARTDYYRKVNARTFLQGFVEDATLDPVLGANVTLRQTNAVPIDMVRPTPKTVGTEKLNTPYDIMVYLRKTNEDKPQRPDVVQNEEGETTFKKWNKVLARIDARHGSDELDHNVLSPDGIEIPGLNTKRVFGKLSGVAGGNMTPQQIEALYDKLLVRAHIGNEPGQYTQAQAQAIFNQGINELLDIYLDLLRKMEATYGRLILQMHPEDICRQFGEEFYEHMAMTQDFSQLADYFVQNGDANSEKVREYVMLSDYFMDIFNRSFTYFGHSEGNTPADTYEFVEGQDPVRNLYDVERFRSIKGPAMTGAQKRKYNENLKKRFHKMGPQWDLKIFGEFRGVNR